MINESRGAFNTPGVAGEQRERLVDSTPASASGGRAWTSLMTAELELRGRP